MPSRALAIGAHPDDIEFGCGATLARWAAAGLSWSTTWSSPTGPRAPGTPRPTRRRSSPSVRTSAGPRPPSSTGTHGAVQDSDRVLFLGEVDGELANGSGSDAAVARLLRRLRPDVVLGHDPWRRYRLHPDHRAAGFLAIDALVAARDPHFFPELGPQPHRPGRILLFEADQPNHVEDANGFAAVKVDALLCHRSQSCPPWASRPTSRKRNGEQRRPLSPTKVRRQLADHGSLAGLPVGEAFHLHRPGLIDRV